VDEDAQIGSPVTLAESRLLASSCAAGDHRARHVVEPLQVVGNLARPKVIALAEIEDLADDLSWRRGWRVVRAAAPIPQAGLAIGLKPSFPSVACRAGCSAGSERVHRALQSSYRPEGLNAHLFESIAELRALTDAWLRIYNGERPHDSLGPVPPLTFLPRPSSAEKSSIELSA